MNLTTMGSLDQDDEVRPLVTTSRKTATNIESEDKRYCYAPICFSFPRSNKALFSVFTKSSSVHDKEKSKRAQYILYRVACVDFALLVVVFALSMQSSLPLSYDFFVGALMRILGVLHIAYSSSADNSISGRIFLPTLGQDLICVSFLYILVRVLIFTYSPVIAYEPHLFWLSVAINFSVIVLIADYVEGKKKFNFNR